ncbi:hypothetical protein [Glutamicibacter nicotianae]|uniref:hypothetical protein n=1 Tax=Glutamicibacter nicotianae TaxID=37929 RepID=UPI000EF87EA1|nr:hypothetical protein [Glutamicibacter nicotianae]
MGANEKHAATCHGVRHDPELNLVRAVYAGASPVPSYDERAEAFDRTIAKVRAEAKAEALEELADTYGALPNFQTVLLTRAARMRDRANQYKEEQ